MRGWMRGWIVAWLIDAWVDGCVDAWMRGCVDAWLRGCVDAWMRGCGVRGAGCGYGQLRVRCARVCILTGWEPCRPRGGGSATYKRAASRLGLALIVHQGAGGTPAAVAGDSSVIVRDMLDAGILSSPEATPLPAHTCCAMWLVRYGMVIVSRKQWGGGRSNHATISAAAAAAGSDPGCELAAVCAVP
jgi:hypothetical protein